MRRPCLLACVGVAAAVVAVSAGRRETFTATSGVPAHIAGQFDLALNFQQAANGQYYVFDRRGHAVYRIESDLQTAKKIVQIGQEEGRLYEPTAFDLEPEGTFVVADAVAGTERIQVFNSVGQRVTGFNLPGRFSARLTLGSLVLNGIGSLQYTGRSVLLNYPETGALVTEFGLGGTPTRSFGHLRPTGHEQDRDVHLALNSGLPLVNPKGGFYFVFLAGEPIFRRYDSAGTLVYERIVQGSEMDQIVRALPSTWPRRKSGPDKELPLVLPTVRTAAVDPDGNLWIAFASVPITYVFDGEGDKIRMVKFEAAGTISPTSLFFPSKHRVLATPGCYEFRIPR
jgi:hypothetical protein